MTGAIVLAALIVGTVSPGIVYAELQHRKERSIDDRED